MRWSPAHSRSFSSESVRNVTFELQPILQGDLVTLRPLSAEDFAALYAVASDPLIWEQHPDKSRHHLEGFRVFFGDALASGGAFAVIDRASNAMVGSSRFHAFDAAKSEVEIGWTFLARSHWGGKYNLEMKQLMLRHAFRFARRVVFRVGPQNVRSQRAVEKLGAIRESASVDVDGREHWHYVLCR